MVKNYRKWVKNSKIFISFENFTQHSAFELRTSEANFRSIVQRNISPFDPGKLSYSSLSFSWSNFFLSHPNMCVLSHTEIRIFFAYRARHTQKKHRNPSTYAVVLRRVTYKAANKGFKGKNWSKLWFFVQDGVRVEGERTWWCGSGCAKWFNGPTSIIGMWFV